MLGHELSADEYGKLLESGEPVEGERGGLVITHGYRPTPEQVKAARAEAGLTQKEAAALVYISEVTWKGFEAPVDSSRYSQPQAALWELFLNKRFL